MKHKPTVTIAISAYNEEANIKNLLISLLAQKQTNFELEKIIVISDGSNDKTVEMVKSIKNRKIELVECTKREGLATRLNELFFLNISDVLIKIDADVLPINNKVIFEIVKKFNAHVSLVSGPRKTLVHNFIQKIHFTGDYIWHETKKEFKNGDNIHNHHGTISAMSKELTQKIRIHNGYYGLDDFVYLSNLKIGKKFKFSEKATVIYKTPSTIADYIKQHRRFLYAKYMLAKHFGEWIYKEYKIPTNLKLKGLIKGFLRWPIETISYLLLEIFIRLILKIRKYNNQKYGWDIAKTTKLLKVNKI